MKFKKRKKKETNQTAEFTAVFYRITNQVHNYMIFIALDFLCPGDQLAKQSQTLKS